MSDPRDEFLKTLDFNMLEVREYPRIAFLCGGNPEVFSTQDDGKVTSASSWGRISRFFSWKSTPQRQHFPSVRSYLSQLLSIKHPELRFQNAEDIKDWNSYSAYEDLIEFEKDIAHLCKAIVLFVESPGSIAELGTFCVIPEISKKLVVFVHTDYAQSSSFVSLGPLKKIDDAAEDRVHYITWGLEKKNIQGNLIDVINQDSLAEWGEYTCNTIKIAIEKTVPVEHTSDEYRRTKEALFIHDVICLFKAVDEVEMTLPLNSVSLNALIMRHPSTVPPTSFARTALD